MSSFVFRSFTLFFLAGLILFPKHLQAQNSKTVEECLPYLATYALPYGVLVKLKPGTLLISDNVRIDESEIYSKIRRSKPSIRNQLQKNAFYILEKIAAERLLLQEALVQGEKRKGTSEEIIARYLDQKFKDLPVTDEELGQYYQENKHLLGDPDLDPFKESLRDFLKEQKKQKAIRHYILTLGQRRPIQVNEDWAESQHAKAKNNPLDRLRSAGKPALVLFRARGECPCDLVSPILIELGKKYKNRIEVLIISLREDRVLADRYGVQIIPDLVFFDDKGREVYRHVGFLPEREIEEKLKQFGLI